MIRCPVCGHENGDLETVCVSCKGFLQSKVDTLDLFSSIWGLMHSPRLAFRRIVLSKHKNYVILLTALLGMAILYSVLWFRNMGRIFSGLFGVLLTGIVAGPVVGIVFTVIFTVVMVRLGHLLGGKTTFRVMYAVVAYASVPILLTMVFVFPIEVAIFGIYLFDNNPPPLVINPVLYVMLLGFDALGVLWAWLLLIEGSIIANGFTRLRAVLLALGVFLLTAGGAVVIRYL